MSNFVVALVIILSLSQGLYALAKSHKIELQAKSISATKTQVIAKEDVVIYYSNSVITASLARYDKANNLLIIDGDIQMIAYDGSKYKSNHMEIYTQEDEVTFDELFLVAKNDVWIFSKEASKHEGNYTLGHSVISSCDIENPLWKMVFKASRYDSENAYMRLYDAKVYLWDIPLFYTPYLAFTTKNERSSGVLFPIFGYSSNDGVLYEQPLYWALSSSIDVEVNPQIRSERSIGAYSTFRFANTAYASGQIRTGYFKDKQSYVNANNLTEDSHYGFELNYDSEKLLHNFLPDTMKDGLYINSTVLNDIDYLNLQNKTLSHFGLVPLQESRLNYFINHNLFYAGVNAKYFIDTRKQSNSDTVQILPFLQYHHYLNRLFWNNLTYSADITMNNFDREEGVRLKQANITLPLEFSTSFFDDFIHLILGEELTYSKFFFDEQTPLTYDTFSYYSNIHKVKLFSDLTKKYQSKVHVLQPFVEYIHPGDEKSSPVDFELLDEEQQALFSVGLPEELYTLGLNQYLYDETMKLLFYQRLKIESYPQRENIISNIGNEMRYSWDGVHLYSHIIYAYAFDKIREASHTLGFTHNLYKLDVGHTYKAVLEDDTTAVSANDLLLSFTYPYSTKVDINGGVTYDMANSASTQWNIGGKYKRDCWSVATSIRQDITPRPTGFTTNTSFYIELNFIPFGSFGTGGE